MRCDSIAAAAATNFVGNGFIRSARTAPSCAAAAAFPLRGRCRLRRMRCDSIAAAAAVAFPLRGRCRLRRMRCNSIAAAAATHFVGNGFIRSARTAPSYAAALLTPPHPDFVTELLPKKLLKTLETCKVVCYNQEKYVWCGFSPVSKRI